MEVEMELEIKASERGEGGHEEPPGGWGGKLNELRFRIGRFGGRPAAASLAAAPGAAAPPGSLLTGGSSIANPRPMRESPTARGGLTGERSGESIESRLAALAAKRGMRDSRCIPVVITWW